LRKPGEAPPCGPNLEHDLSFFELEEAARGKAEQRTGDVVKPAEERTGRRSSTAPGDPQPEQDLRVAVHLTRALAYTEGIP